VKTCYENAALGFKTAFSLTKRRQKTVSTALSVGLHDLFRYFIRFTVLIPGSFSNDVQKPVA